MGVTEEFGALVGRGSVPRMGCSCCTARLHSPSKSAMSESVTTQETRAVLSELAVTMRWPSGEKAACQTPPSVAFEADHELPVGRVPDSRRLVGTGSNDALAVGREGGVPDMVCVAFELGEELPVGRVPHSRRLVPAGGDDGLAVER